MSAPTARWKALCLDAADPVATGGFWASALGRRRRSSSHTHPLDGASPAERVWINAVSRPRTVKNRVHLDLYAASVAELETAGARVLEPASATGREWTVMVDPEGHELCCFVRRDPPTDRLAAVVVDCADHVAQARWWAAVLGEAVDPTYAPESYGVPTGAGPLLVFVAVPEERRGPNRVHWDVVGDASALLDAGARHLWDTEGWRVLADPEGNEFCVFEDAAGRPVTPRSAG